MVWITKDDPVDFLQSVLGNLDQAQNKEDVLRVLGDIEYWYNYIVHGPTFNQDVPEDTNPAEVTPWQFQYKN